MSGKYKKSIIWAVIYILGLIKVGFIFSFYSDSGFCGRRPGRLDRSVKAFVDFIGSSPARKNKRFCFSLAYSKNSLTGGTPHFVRQTPPVGRSENLTGHSFLFQWFSATTPSIFRLHYRPKKGEGKYYKLEKQVEYGYLGYLTGFSYYLQNTDF